MSRREERFRELCAGQALGLLNEDERWELDELLASATPEWLAFYHELELTALHLPAGAELVEPPPEVRTRILEAIAAEQQATSGLTREKRHERPSAAAKERAPKESPGRGLAGWLELIRPRLIVVAVLVVGLMALGFYAHTLRRAVSEARQHATLLAEDLQQKERLLEVLEARRFEVFALQGTELHPEGHGKLIWDQENRVAVLQVGALPPVPADKVYVLWIFARDADPTRAGVFAVNDPQHDTFFRFDGFAPGDRQSIRGFLITLETRDSARAPGDAWYLGARVGS